MKNNANQFFIVVLCTVFSSNKGVKTSTASSTEVLSDIESRTDMSFSLWLEIVSLKPFLDKKTVVNIIAILLFASKKAWLLEILTK